jgi:nitrite reductase (NADH) small subunit
MIVKLCERSELPLVGQMKTFRGAGLEICVARGDSVYAFDNRCPHQGAPLSAGLFRGTTVVCPYHAWAFDVSTGKSEIESDPPLEMFETRQWGDEVFIKVPDLP